LASARAQPGLPALRSPAPGLAHGGFPTEAGAAQRRRRPGWPPPRRSTNTCHSRPFADRIAARRSAATALSPRSS
jgi:hypothetical protein